MSNDGIQKVIEEMRHNHRECDGSCETLDWADRLSALAAQQPQPAGMKLMPKAPTIQMIEAGFRELTCEAPTYSEVESIYQAIFAAFSAEQPQQDATGEERDPLASKDHDLARSVCPACGGVDSGCTCSRLPRE